LHILLIHRHLAAGQDGWTALHIAAEEGHRDVISTLIARGAPIDAIEEQVRHN